MWDGLVVLVLLCAVMASASFLTGMLPLYFSLSSRQLRLISALGTGVLVGTALIIIIPEGVETLYSANQGAYSLGERSIPLVPRTLVSSDTFPASLIHDTRRRDEFSALPVDTGLGEDGDYGLGEETDGDFSVEEATAAQELEQSKEEQDGAGEQEEPEHDSHDPHAWVGASLITGFILMYLIDTLPRHAVRSTQPQRFHISLNNLSFNRTPSINVENAEPPTPTTPSHSHTSRPSSTTTGLVIHACADGIALGASSTTTGRLTFIIFIALMIHKAPAAFGLTSVLLKQGLSKRAARAHLIVFSLAAPVGALLTWASAHLLGYSSAALSHSMSTEFATGILLLFSGGTFLYVAMHTMQDGGHEHGGEGHTNGYAGVPMSDMYEASNVGQQSTKGEGKKKLSETMVTVAGMLVPLLTQIGGHGH